MRQLVPLRTAWLGVALLTGHTACALVAADAVESRVVPDVELSSAQPPAGAEREFDALFDSDLELVEGPEPNDPFEPANRALLSFNQSLARHVFDPMIRGYRFVMPDPARRGVRRAFLNLKAPATLVNDLLQLRFADAARTTGRFLLNTTIGMGGIFDVAVEAGWHHHEADFGQTLGRFGVGSGPYLVLPVFGPNTIRDGFGDLIDLFFQPLTYLIGPAQNLVIGAGSGFSTLDAHDAALKALEDSSVDFYAALRSAYLQDRAAQIDTAAR